MKAPSVTLYGQTQTMWKHGLSVPEEQVGYASFYARRNTYSS
jgi:hypothetical protein